MNHQPKSRQRCATGKPCIMSASSSLSRRSQSLPIFSCDRRTRGSPERCASNPYGVLEKGQRAVSLANGCAFPESSHSSNPLRLSYSCPGAPFAPVIFAFFFYAPNEARAGAGGEKNRYHKVRKRGRLLFFHGRITECSVILSSFLSSCPFLSSVTKPINTRQEKGGK